ncbi:unnamed protein product [Schistosoma curassoni]|uniref:Reverse transcriptase domain-containing protein n=1 Tax=Schistosoma curassoni TaxID=6186 RepID=A0A183KDK1_9TREM|nr:unnamed protein product [Schistosoma curassoni]
MRNEKTAVNEGRTRTEKFKAQAEHTEANKEVKKSIGADKQKSVEDLATTAGKAAREKSMKQLYDTTEKLTGKYSKPERQVKDKEDKQIPEIQGQRNRWVENPEELSNRPTLSNPLDIGAAPTDLLIDVTSPTIEEIRMTTRLIKSGEIAGPDNIPTEALKSEIEATADMLHVLFKKIWEEERVPTDWKGGHLVKIPKKGGLSACENYRSTTLPSVLGNVFKSVAEPMEGS